MAKRKIALRQWEDNRLEQEDDDSEESEDWYEDDGIRDDNVFIDEDGAFYYE